MSLFCLRYLLCTFFVFVFSFLHKKSVRLVQRLLLYPDDRGPAGRPPQFPPQDVLAELGRVHSSSTGGHDFKSSLLQPLEDLHKAKTSIWLGGHRSSGHTNSPKRCPEVWDLVPTPRVWVSAFRGRPCTKGQEGWNGCVQHPKYAFKCLPLTCQFIG